MYMCMPCSSPVCTCVCRVVAEIFSKDQVSTDGDLIRGVRGIFIDCVACNNATYCYSSYIFKDWILTVKL